MLSNLPNQHKIYSLVLIASSACLNAWSWAVILMGRSLPWQMSRWWLVFFSFVFTLSFAWYWYRLRRVDASRADCSKGCVLTLWFVSPTIAVNTLLLGAIYLSDYINALIAQQNWRMQVFAGMAILTLLLDCAQQIAIAISTDRKKGFFITIREVLSARSNLVVLGSLGVVGILQAAASVPPTGDDMKYYSDVADAILLGHAYEGTGPRYVGNMAQMGVHYAALPVFPALLAISFSAVGRTLLGVILPIAVANALFPLAFYSACKAVTNSRPVAYVASILVTLFPIYQVHVLGLPGPDTLFIVLLLFGATLAGKANSSPRRRYWIGMGLVFGLVSLTRHEGIAYAAVMFLTFILVHRSNRNYWLSVSTYIFTLIPFVAILFLKSGQLWPSKIGGSILSLDNLDGNLTNLRISSISWYAQALGVDDTALVVSVIIASLGVIVGGILLWREHSALVGIPIAGIGNIAMVLLMSPALVYSVFPPDFLRHISYGIAFEAVTLAYMAHLCLRYAFNLSERFRPLLLVLILLISCNAVYWESERLARPGWQFEGRWSLLWTGTYYLLTDVVDRHPVPLWQVDDLRPLEQVQAEMKRAMEDVNLNRLNRSEAYHWTSMMVSLLGLAFVVTPIFYRPRSTG